MKTLTRVLFGFAAAFAITSSAHAIPFIITKLSFTPGNGYGGANGTSTSDDHDFLDATFTPKAAPGTFELDVDQTYSFAFGSVTLNETCIDAKSTANTYYCGVKGNETNNLGVTASFSFAGPYSGISTVTATGSATPGQVKDNTGPGDDNSVEDLKIHFGTAYVDFGTGGRFSIDLSDLSFTRNQTLDTSATIRLLSAPTTPADVPEPASLGLIGLGLLGAGLARRRKSS